MYTYSMKVRSCLFIFITLTNGNGGEGGREGTMVECVTKGGSGGPPPEKNWNLDPLRLILRQFEGQKSYFITNQTQTYICMLQNCNLNGLCHCLFHFTVLYNRECENAKGGQRDSKGGRMPAPPPPPPLNETLVCTCD